MDSGDSKEDGPKRRRRTTRQTSKTGSYAAVLRPRLKRGRSPLKDDGESTVVNGSKESNSLENGSDDGPSNKKSKIETDENEKGDVFNHTDVEMDESEDQGQEMVKDKDAEQDNEIKTPFHATSRREAVRPAQVWRENLESGVVLERRKSIHENSVDYDIQKHNISNRSITTSQALSGTEERFPAVRQRPMWEKTEHQETHKKPKTVNTRSETTSQAPSVMRITSSRTSNQNPLAVNDALHFGNWNRPQLLIPPTTKQAAHHKNTEKKPIFSKASPVSPTRGWMWSICVFILLMLTVLLVSGCLIYHKFICAHLPQTDVVRSETLKNFAMDLAGLQTVFPSQRSEFWKRSGKHLKGHLQTVQPTEPVSVILTAGLRAEKTLGCLARRLATVFSAYHNASILEINGNSKSALDSDAVKLEIDEALIKAFEGDKPAAVVHHFEELPPGSTLIFYRYCDHETAAYKNVFLVFTVKLSVDDIDPSVSLSRVEEMVLDHITQKFITSEKSAMFNQMDLDKLSGLWSRISHLVLPVAAEENIEQEGCEV